MTEQPMLNEREWELVLELLSNERRNLAPEIHHTRTADVKQLLHERLRMVDNLLDRLAHAPVA